MPKGRGMGIDPKTDSTGGYFRRCRYLAATAAGAGSIDGRTAWACSHAVAAGTASAAASTAPTQCHGCVHVCKPLRPGALPWRIAIHSIVARTP